MFLERQVDGNRLRPRKAFKHRAQGHFLADTALLEATIGLPHDLALTLVDLHPA